jgi:NhaP-type Na+/H+ or K+/H+ antiporter
MTAALVAVVEIIRTLAVCLLAGAAMGWLAWWLLRHGPDKEGQ